MRGSRIANRRPESLKRSAMRKELYSVRATRSQASARFWQFRGCATRSSNLRHRLSVLVRLSVNQPLAVRRTNSWRLRAGKFQLMEWPGVMLICWMGSLLTQKMKSTRAESKRTPLAGYYSPRETTAVLDDLYSKALVLEQDGTRVALVVCDLISLPRRTVVEARQLIEKQTG